ncbi:MAG: hypothetical protein M1120_00140 [Patescibacteria group bacterium]|nr:hypothetical protein [Patescibacteria group bacterium]
MKYFDLDQEEKEILQALEKGKLKSAGNIAKVKKQYEQYARETLAKTKNINIRLSQKDLLKLKAKAVELGLPYQTLIASALHQYAGRPESVFA